MTAHTSSRYAYEGTETTEVTIVRTGGAADPTSQVQSRKIVTTANAQWLRPFQAEPYAIWNPVAGADVDVTVYGIVSSDALPNNDDIWLEVEYLGDSASSLGTIVNTTKSNLLASNAAVSSDSSVWGGTGSSYATWDSTTVTAVTLSGGNLVATNTGTTSADQGAKVAHGKTSGKYYFEVTHTTFTGGGNVGIGIGTIGSTYTGIGATATAGAMVYFTTGNIWSNGGTTALSLGSVVIPTVIGIAVDLDNRKIWFKKIAPAAGNWNGTVGADPATNVSGVTIPSGVIVPFNVFGGTGGVAGNVHTANFGASTFTGTVPSGFASGWTNVWTPFKLTKTLSSPQPGQAGYLEARVRVGAASATYYLDPKVVLTWAGGGTINATTAYKSSRYAYEGTETTETAITRTGGGADPTGQVQSRKIVTTANAQWLRPFQAGPYAVWNPTTGANVTVTVFGLAKAITVPNNDDIWLEVEYLGDASSSLGTIVTTTKASILAANAATASDSSSWGSLVSTFDPTTAQLTALSNGNLTVTCTGSGSYPGVIVPSTSYRSTGKFYFEATVGSTHNVGNLVGLYRPGLTYTQAIGGGSGTTHVSFNGTISSNNAPNTGKTIGAVVAGDVVGVAVDITNFKGWFRKNGGNWNGDAAADPVAGTGSVTLAATSFGPMVVFNNSGVTGDYVTANFGQSAYAFSAPSGFDNWTDYIPFKLTKTLSSPQPGQAGYLEARVRVGAASATYYIDPKIELS